MRIPGSEVTRLALVGALLNGSAQRRRILKKFRNKHRAVAPEIGLDVNMLISVCAGLEKRESRYRIFFTAAIILFFLLSGFESVFGGVIFVITLLTYLYKSAQEQFSIAPNFSQNAYTPDSISQQYPFPENLQRQDASVESVNVVTYTGYNPFYALGDVTERISFSVDLQKTPHEKTATSFNAGELYRAIDKAVLADSKHNIKIRDYLFVHGKDVKKIEGFLPDRFSRPVFKLPETEMAKWMGGKDVRARYYKCVAVQDWGNELIVSYLMRFTIENEQLLVEITSNILTPVKEEYRRLDNRSNMKFFGKIFWAILVLMIAPFATVKSAMTAFSILVGKLREVCGFGHDRITRKRIERTPNYDYGAEMPIRQEMAGHTYRHYFQSMDGGLYEKALRQRLMETIISFLEYKGVDVSALRESQSTIINSGIMVYGGDVTAQSLSVGKNSRSSVANVVKNAANRAMGAKKEAA